MQINIKKLDDRSIVPTYAHAGDAGADLYSIERVVIPIGGIRLIGTGLSIELPCGYKGEVCSRSGMSAKFGVAVLNAPGLIDSGYTGEVKVILINHGDTDYLVQPGDRIAQLVIAPVIRPEFNETTVLDVESERGKGGFGSSGA